MEAFFFLLYSSVKVVDEKILSNVVCTFNYGVHIKIWLIMAIIVHYFISLALMLLNAVFVLVGKTEQMAII